METAGSSKPTEATDPLRYEMPVGKNEKSDVDLLQIWILVSLRHRMGGLAFRFQRQAVFDKVNR